MTEKDLVKKQERFWEKHFEYYDFFQLQFSWYVKTIEFHLNQMKLCRKILDTGAGSGNLTKELLKNNHKVVAIDSEPHALRQLEDKIDNTRELQIIIGDVHHIAVEDGFFDGVTSMFLLPFIQDVETYLEEVYRVLKNEGKFSISAWAPEPDIFKYIKEKIEQEFTEKKILPKNKLAWEEFLTTSAVNASNVTASNLTKEKLLWHLHSVGFKNTEVHPDVAYEDYAYFITCNK